MSMHAFHVNRAKAARVLTVAALFVVAGRANAEITAPDEKAMLGRVVPDVELVAEDSTTFRLSSLAGKPILVNPIFTSCQAVCPEITGSLRDALATIGEPGVGYHVLTVSFDPADGPAELRAYRERLALPAGWKLAVATPENLAELLDGIDFNYETMPEGGFAHPNVVAVLSPALAVSGYLNGMMFEEKEVRTALERAAGRVSLVRHYRPVLIAVALLALAMMMTVLKLTKKKSPSAA